MEDVLSSIFQIIEEVKWRIAILPFFCLLTEVRLMFAKGICFLSRLVCSSRHIL